MSGGARLGVLDGPGSDSPGPIVVIVGNCQAESLRIMLGDEDVTTVRLPPVHELTSEDLPSMNSLLESADVLVSQPIRDDYHGLPVGTAQLRARLPSRARTVVVPVIRFAGLYPMHAIIRPPSHPSLTPPLVAYHDLSTLAEAAGMRMPALSPQAVVDVARLSIEFLRERERRHHAVPISDVFDSADFDAMRTINHPGNGVFAELARRVRFAAGLPALEFDPGRPILASVHAPRHPSVIEAFSLDASPTDAWTVEGEEIAEGEVRSRHLEWYRENPEVVTAGLVRHAESLRLLGAA